MPRFTVTAGFIGGWYATGNVAVEASTLTEACQKVIHGVDEAEIPTDRSDYDPGPTFVEFLATEDGSDLPVPGRFTEHGEARKRERELLFLLRRALESDLEPADLKRAEELIAEKWKGWRELRVRVNGGEPETLGAFLDVNVEIGPYRSEDILEALLWEGFFEEPAAGACAGWRLERVV